MGWLTGGRVTSRGTNSVTIMTTFGGTSGWRLSGVWITSQLRLNTGATTTSSGRVTFSGGSSADVGTASFYNLSPGTTYSVSISSSGGYTNINTGVWSTASATGSLTFTTLKQYTVSYNANGGTSTPGAQTVAEGSGVTLAGGISRNSTNSSGTLTVSYNANGGYAGPSTTHRGEYVNTTTYTFNGWHEWSATGTNHGAGSWFVPGGNITLYAGWNGNTTRKTNPTITLSNSIPVRTNYSFLGWSTNPNATSADYRPGWSYQFSENTILYAVWKPSSPSGVTAAFVSNTTTGFKVYVSALGLGPMNYVVYYKTEDGSYVSKNLGTSITADISNLLVDTNYQFYIEATNPGGTTKSSVVTFSTALTEPTITTPVASDILPFSCTIQAEGDIIPKRDLMYRFSKDGGNTWTPYQSENTYNWTGLNEETTYDMVVEVKATHVGVNAVDTTASKSIAIATPADQAKIRRMIDGQWRKGKTYIMVNGQWVKAKKLYVLVDGQWKLNNND